MKNRVKKSISLLLAVIMLICVVPVIGSAASYNVTAAVNYANAHWNDGVGLCAEFVSRCLNAGGISIPNYSYYSSGTKSYANNSGTLGSYTNPYTCSASLLLYLSEKYKIITNPSNSDIDVGDVVFMYSMSNGQLKWRDGHVGICVKKVSGSPKYAAHNKAQAAGGFSSSYPCTYVAKINSSSSTHTVNSSYGKNFTAYPKAKITAGNIFDANHNQISSTAWIGTSDKCTIHEVYTDGCCKVTYPLDSGGTRTVYSKISLFNTHTHSYYRGVEAAHPHKVYMKCSCGAKYYTGETTTYSSCDSCQKYLTIKYNVNGGSINSSDYKISSNIVYRTSTNAELIDRWIYNEPSVYGLYNASTFGLYKNGYTFVGWSTSKNGEKIFDENDESIVPTDISSEIEYGDCSVTLYAIWAPNVISIKYNANGGKGEELPFTVKYGDEFTILNNSCQKDGFHFGGWNIKRNSDNTWYVAGVGWCSEETIKNNNYEKKNYSNSQQLVIDESWIRGLNGEASYTFYATWIENSFSMRFDANSGTGYMSRISTEFNLNYTFPKSEFVKENYIFNGWNVYRVNDGTWATVGYGWLTSDELKNRNIDKQLFAEEDTYKLDNSWKVGCNDSYIEYVAYAMWSPCSHKYNIISEEQSNCIKEGYTKYYCDFCSATKTETLPKNPSNHAGGTAVKNALAATCTAKGYTGDTYCLGCGVITLKGKEIAATGHTDTNNDGKCDICSTAVGTPSEPEKPDTPSETCNHICHKSGIARFFYLIARLFWKMFKTNKYCSCGAAHY